MDFGDAIKELKEGHRVTRSGWNGKGMWIAIKNPTDDSEMDRPYIYIKSANDELVPWLASQSDILEEDWETIQEDADILTAEFIADSEESGEVTGVCPLCGCGICIGMSLSEETNAIRYFVKCCGCGYEGPWGFTPEHARQRWADVMKLYRKDEA